MRVRWPASVHAAVVCVAALGVMAVRSLPDARRYVAMKKM